MNKNVRVSGAFRQGLNGNGQAAFFYPLAISLICHLVLFVLIAFAPSLRFDNRPTHSVINVSMVTLKTEKAPSSSPAVKQPAPKNEKQPTVKQTPAKPQPAPVIKTAPPSPKPKTSLKKKTFKSAEVVKHAIRQMEKNKRDPAADQKEKPASPEMLKSALDRLREEVSSAEAAKAATDAANRSEQKNGQAAGKLGKFSEQGKRKAELIDLYRLEIAFQIQKQWAFNEALAGADKSLVAAIVFKVMPDGEIRDIFFTDRSGNTYLDESAYKAILKSNPVDRHPNGLNQPFVEMGIRFTPQGIR